jgi:hypothetical protein
MMMFVRMLNIMGKICISCFCALVFIIVGAITVSGSQEGAEASKSSSEVVNSSVAEEEPAFIDWMQDGIHTSIDSSARWFDGFFGDSENKSGETYGRVSTRVIWKNREGFKISGRLKARTSLENFQDRVDAVLMKGDSDDYLEGRSDMDSGLRGAIPSSSDDDWIAGVGYAPSISESARIRLGAGIRFSTPINPYVRARYGFLHHFSDQSLMRVRETVFWKSRDGFGTTTNLDLERTLNGNFLLRWTNAGTFGESVRGVDWESTLTLYQNIGENKAMAYLLMAEGETDHDVSLREYGFRAVYRQQMFREWFFGEILGGVTWPKYGINDSRRAALHVGIGFEILFGDHSVRK